MKLPNYEDAIIPQAKITEYLLSFTHRDGRSKANFFHRFGFSIAEWKTLATALQQHAAENPVTKTEPSRFGTRYVIDGIIRTPDGRTPTIRAVWFVDQGGRAPRFATAYPLSRRDK
jgi:hypothetical protein